MRNRFGRDVPCLKLNIKADLCRSDRISNGGKRSSAAKTGTEQLFAKIGQLDDWPWLQRLLMRQHLVRNDGAATDGTSTLPRRKSRPLFHMGRFSGWHRSKRNKSAVGLGVSTDADTANKCDSAGQAQPSGCVQEEQRSLMTAKSSGKDSRECQICFVRQPVESFVRLSNCSHRACHSCMVRYLEMQISESRVNLSCPECSELLHPNDVYGILSSQADVIRKYEEFSLRRVLMTDPDTRWCPAPDCGYAVIASSCAACPELKCERPGCGASFCYHCKMIWHSNQTCDEARAKRRSIVSSPIEIDVNVRPGDIKACPRCRTYIVKMNDGSCNHMVCALCGVEFCWLCLKEISDLHYLSPSGCTFWGKKPWSRKKKLFWQIGMLVGAPIGIAVVTSLAVPAIIFGFPVWVGRKLHQRVKCAKRYKRIGTVACGVLGSVLLSPVLAVLAISVGVPILLAYVYGVVLVSLCRDGSCGVTSHSSSLKLSLDENILTMTAVANDPSSLEKALLLRGIEYNDTVMGNGDSAATSRQVEVDVCEQYTSGQAEVISTKTFETACFDERSIRTLGSVMEACSLQDGASLKVLNGSIAGCSRSVDETKSTADLRSDAFHSAKSVMDMEKPSMKRLESRVTCYADESGSDGANSDEDECGRLLVHMKTKRGPSVQSLTDGPSESGRRAPTLSCKHKSLSISSAHDMAEFMILPADAIINNSDSRKSAGGSGSVMGARTVVNSIVNTLSSRSESFGLFSRKRRSMLASCQSGLSSVVSFCTPDPSTNGTCRTDASDVTSSQSMPDIRSDGSSEASCEGNL